KTCETVYIGGGTPTCLSDSVFERFLGVLRPYFSCAVEVTMEVNPETLTPFKVGVMRDMGINRVSMGLQSADPTLLKLMNRHHSYEDVVKAIGMLKEVGITNISLDLMYSLPDQSIELWKDTLEKTIELEVPHISLYSLTIEPNTLFDKKGYTSLDEDTEAQMYEIARDYLISKGYIHYEISNFCKKGYESKHNLGYWNYDDFYGISMGASGKENNIRYDNTEDFKDYFNHNYTKEIIELSTQDQMFEMIMMGLRKKEGMNLKLFEERFHTSFDSVYQEKKDKAIEKGLLEDNGEYIRCTKESFEICNTVILEFLD
ncbi:MAG: radical SAM family heme chaperone HemW, partial [Erysipelotrichaceae bacterium]|nr:radical SAM family heme chaperone HemW [Erysipelotrichaceae bacterium]